MKSEKWIVNKILSEMLFFEECAQDNQDITSHTSVLRVIYSNECYKFYVVRESK